jgi:hypothetical protein
VQISRTAILSFCSDARRVRRRRGRARDGLASRSWRSMPVSRAAASNIARVAPCARAGSHASPAATTPPGHTGRRVAELVATRFYGAIRTARPETVRTACPREVRAATH